MSKYFLFIIGLIMMAKLYAWPLSESIDLIPPSSTWVNHSILDHQFDGEIVNVIELDSSRAYLDNKINILDNYYIAKELNNIHYDYTESDFLDYHDKIAEYNRYLELNPNSLELKQQRQIYFDHALIALNRLLIKNPDLAESLSQAAGYGIFQATSLNLVLYAGGWGGGVVFDNQEHRVIYVSIFRAGTGWGLGYINDLVLVIFHDHAAITQYFGVGGKGADVGASASLGVYGGTMSFNPYISMYKLYNYGANIQANWGATLYWAPPELNQN